MLEPNAPDISATIVREEMGMSRDLVLAAGYFRISEARDGMSAPEIYRSEFERYCCYKQLEPGITSVAGDAQRDRRSLVRIARSRLDFERIEQ
jgi:hypothetical protein